MSSTAFEVVLETLHTQLSAAPAIASAVLLMRERPMALEVDKEIAVTLQRASGQQFALTAGPVDWDMPVQIALRARGHGTATTAYARIGELLAAVWQRLGSTTWPAGVQGTLDADIAIEIAEAGDLVAEARLALLIKFRTQAGSLALAP